MDNEAATTNPWEERAERGFFSALWSTWKLSIGRPAQFYRTVSLDDGFGGHLFYGFLVSLFGVWFTFFWQFLFTVLGAPARTQLGYPSMGFEAQVIVTLFAPGVALFTLFISAAVLHGSLWLVRGAHQPFAATFRVICYATGPSLFSIVPFCGGLIGGVWSFVMYIIGAREVHGISTRRATLAALLPVLLLCGIGLFIVLMIGTLGIGPIRY